MVNRFFDNANMCMLNGRSLHENNATSISVHGSSVVDYCLVAHDQVCKFNDFKVSLTTDVINSCVK